MRRINWLFISLFFAIAHTLAPLSVSKSVFERLTLSLVIGAILGFVYLLSYAELNNEAQNILRSSRPDELTWALSYTKYMAAIHAFVIPMVFVLIILNLYLN